MAITTTTKMTRTATPGIYRRGGRYVVVTTHKGKQHKSSHATLAEAREAKGDRTRGGASKRPQSRAPFDEHARAWVATCQGRTRRGLDEDTREAYRVALEAHAIPHFRNTPLRDVEPEDYLALVAKLQAGVSAASVRKYCAPVKALFADAFAHGHLQRNPTTGVRIGGSKNDEPEPVRPLTRVELDAVLAAVAERHALFFELMAHTGARVSEVLGLDWADVDFDPGRLRIHQQWYRGRSKALKSGNGRRTIDLAPGMVAMLWSAGADRTGAMFHTRTGGRLSDRNLRRVLDAASARAGLEPFGHHRFRHTHGSMLLAAGWPLPAVADRLGDTVETVAKTYAHAMPGEHRDLGFLMGKGGQENIREQPQTTVT